VYRQLGIEEHTLWLCDQFSLLSFTKKYTHAAIATAKLAIANALNSNGKRLSELVILTGNYQNWELKLSAKAQLVG
jgi:hypothetical protein